MYWNVTLCTHLEFALEIFTTTDLFLRYGIRIVSVYFLDAAMYTPAYLHTFIGCNKTPVFTQALKIQKLNERNDVQCCVPLLVVTIHTWITHERHCQTHTYLQGGMVDVAQRLRAIEKRNIVTTFPKNSAPCCEVFPFMLPQCSISSSWGQRLSGCPQ